MLDLDQEGRALEVRVACHGRQGLFETGIVEGDQGLECGVADVRGSVGIGQQCGEPVAHGFGLELGAGEQPGRGLGGGDHECLAARADRFLHDRQRLGRAQVAETDQCRRGERVARHAGQLEQLGREVGLAEACQARITAAFQARSLLVCQIRLSSGIAGDRRRPKGLDGLVAQVDLRKMLDRLRVSIAKTVSPQECDQLELAREVGFFVEMRPEGAAASSLSIRRRASIAK